MIELELRHKQLYEMLLDSLTRLKFTKNKQVKGYLQEQIDMIKEEMRKIEWLIGE